MLKFEHRIGAGFACAAALSISFAGPAAGQSAGSYTSGSSFNPVQQAINRNSMNAAIIHQATGKHRVAAHRTTRRTTTHR